MILDDGWEKADVGAARIVHRAMSGGRGQPTSQRLTIDLADDGYSDNGTPGTVVQDDGNL